MFSLVPPEATLVHVAAGHSPVSVARSSVKEHVSPCVVLVINDNLYGLMFASSFICRTCPYTTLEPYVGFKVVRRCI
jgi:hypothetical protein